MAGETELPGLSLELALGRARAGDDEANAAAPANDRGERVEREVEALLVHEAADQQHEQLVGVRVASLATPADPSDRLEVARVDPVRDRGDLRRPDAEHVGDVHPHVARAGDHVIGAADHRALGGVDVGLRVVLDPALVAAVLGGVDGDQPRPIDLARRPVGRAGDEPVVRVHEVELEPVAKHRRQRMHVAVHRLDPAYERARVLGERGLPDPVDDHAVLVGLGRQAAAAAREHVHLDAVADQLLGQLADVAAEAALDHRRVLPGDQQDAHGTARDPTGCRRTMTPFRVVTGPQGSITPIAQAPDPIDPGVRIGHTHLRTADIDRIRDFYVGVLGFDVISEARDVPGWGTTGDILFLSAGGYHHHLGFNTWKSKGGPPTPDGVAGLHHVAIAYPTRKALADAYRRLKKRRLADPAAHRPRHARGDIRRRSRRQHARADVGPAAGAVAARRAGPHRRRVRSGPRPRRPAARARLEPLEHRDPELADDVLHRVREPNERSSPRSTSRHCPRGASIVPSTGPLRTATATSMSPPRTNAQVEGPASIGS